MIIFDQLRISDDGKKLYINLRVNNADYFDNVYLDSIVITTADKVSETDPYAPSKDSIYTKSFDDDVKEFSVVLQAVNFIKSWETDADKMNFKVGEMPKTLFFVYVTCRGTLNACTPCALDEATTVGVTFDEKLLYQKAMGYTKALADGCSVPVGFADFILLWNAFKAAVETDHYIPAIKYWNMLFGAGSALPAVKDCGCHG